MLEVLKENKKLGLYKHVVKALGEYSDTFPATGVAKYFDNVVQLGMPAMPSDANALDIIANIFCYASNSSGAPAQVQKLLNVRFMDLPITVRPVYKDGRKHLVAFWCKDGNVNDKVLSLINIDGKAQKGFWADPKGNKVTLFKKEVI